MANRLSSETSPYLLQHAENPVDWYPWGEEALERSRLENRPILLSSPAANPDLIKFKVSAQALFLMS